MADKPARGGGGRWIFIGFGAIAAVLLIMEHRAHVLEFLPVALLLACVLLHLFHGHGGHRDQGGRQKQDQGGRRPDP